MDSTTTNCAYIHLSQRVSFSWTRPAPTAAGTHATPDADGDPEANMDTSVPTTMIPPRTSSTDLASHHHKRTSKSDSRNFQLQFRDARRHARLEPTQASPPFKPPHPPFPMNAHAEPFESALSSPLSRSRSPSSSPCLHAHKN
jgi:hypothetical protein